MPSFTFHETDGGRNIELNPTYVRPFGPSEIRALEANDAAALEMELQADGVLIDGVKASGRATLNTRVIFNKPTTIYALVRGGWVPMPFAVPSRFLVDRNVVITLREIREGKFNAKAESLQWWTQFFAQGSGTFSPLPYAFEAGFRQKPTMPEFVAAYDEGVAELTDALPACNVIKYTDSVYRTAYSLLENFDQRNEREIAFLQATCPLVAQRITRQGEFKVAEEIARSADQHEVERASIVSLAVFSCLFEDVHGVPKAIGKRVLKPKLIYSEADAYNALSDLRHIEIAVAAQTYFRQDAFSLCTCDRPLALLWSALSPRGEATTCGSMKFTFSLTEDLFSRLSGAELHKLKQLVPA